MHLNKDYAVMLFATSAFLDRNFDKTMVVSKDHSFEQSCVDKLRLVRQPKFSLLIRRPGIYSTPPQSVRHTDVNVLIGVDS